MNIAVGVATSVIETLILSIYLKGLFQNYVRKPPYILISYAIYCAGLSVLSILPLNLMVSVGYALISFITLAKLLFDTKWLTALFSSMLLTAIFIIVDIVSSGIIRFFGIPVESMMEYGTARIIFVVLAKMVQIFCVFLVIKLSQWRNSSESLIDAIPLLLCQVFSIFICYIMYLGAMKAAAQVTVSFILGAVGILYINIVIFVFVERVKAVGEIKKQNALAEQQYKSKLEYFEQVKDDQAETRALWHDIRKYLNTMNDLMSSNELDHARECISQVSELFANTGLVVDVGNTVISAVLNHSVQKARRQNIDTALDVRVKPDLNISAADLSVIIGNTFDNAIEAVSALDKKDGRISIQLIEKNSILFYEITNQYDPDKPVQKKNPKQHGFGLKNVRRCVDKYKGTMQLSQEDGTFKVSVHLNIPAQAGTLLAS